LDLCLPHTDSLVSSSTNRLVDLTRDSLKLCIEGYTLFVDNRLGLNMLADCIFPSLKCVLGFPAKIVDSGHILAEGCRFDFHLHPVYSRKRVM
jgi:hypothetical protein